jgi:hypothetical protein
MIGNAASKYPKASVRWHGLARSGEIAVEGVINEITPRQAYICCAKPFRLNQEVDMILITPKRTIQLSAEVVWSNIYGYDDEITPRGMGLRFLQISEEDQKYVSDLIEQYKEPDIERIASEYLVSLTESIDTN